LTIFSYTVTYDPDNTAVDITSHVEWWEITLTGSGTVRRGTMMLNGLMGAFMTNTNSGATPLVDEFNLIQISWTDEDSVTITENFEVVKDRPREGISIGSVNQIDLLGPEHHLLRFPVSPESSRRDRADSAYFKSGEIIDIYNDEKGSLQPTVSAHDTAANTLPKFTANHYPFSLAPIPVHDALTYIVDRVSTSRAAGGGGNLWEYGFKRNPADETDLKFFSVISGSTDSGVTISRTTGVNTGDEEGGNEATRATVSLTWGADNRGTNPPNVGQFRDALTAWRAMPDYESGVTYPDESIVRRRNTGPDSQGDEFHFKSNKETSSAPPTSETDNTDWDSYVFTEFLANEMSISALYSPWTLNKDDEWKTCGGNPDGDQNDDPPDANSLAVWDMNKVVYDGSFYRDTVDVRATSPAGVPFQYKYSGTDFYRGFRVLVDGTGSGDFAGFDNNIIEYDSFNSEWRLFRATSDGEYCAVDDEAKVYKRSSGTWADDSGSDRANDCYHPVLNISNVAGHINKNNGAGGTVGDASAVQYEFRYANSDVAAPTSPQYYRAGACINLKPPFPPNSYNGTTIGSEIATDSSVREPATISTNNMDYATNSKRGYNHVRSDEYGPYSAIRFMMDFEWRFQVDGSGSLVSKGNIPFKCFMRDLHNNVVTADFTISHNNTWEMVTVPFSAFSNYRARLPISIESLGQNLFLQELEILQEFDYQNIKEIGLQWMHPYDEDGRYNLLGATFGALYPSLFDIITGASVNGHNIKWKIDAFHFVKPLLSVTAPVTTGRAMFVEEHEEPLITNRYQNDQANVAYLEQDQFPTRDFIITTNGKNDIGLFEQFTLNNSNLINDSDNGANTLNLVAKEITYTVDKPETGVGGFMRTIKGVKRLE